MNRRAGEHCEPIEAPEPRQAPAAKTVDERLLEDRERNDRRRAIGGMALILLGLVALHLTVHVPGLGQWATLVFLLVWIGLWISRRVRRTRHTTSPIRGVFLLWLAVAVASVALVSLDSFSGENLIMLAIVWGILGVLWVADRALRRVPTLR